MGLIFLRNRVSGVAPAFDPASLFASGEEGVWYEPSPTTCFTDALGTAAATYGDEVQYLEDLSGNGNHATQTTLASRPILARVPEGGRRNELVSTATLATQSVTVTAAERTLSFKGTGIVTLTGASTAGPLVGTGVSDRATLTFTPSAGSLTLTVSGTVTDAQLELGSSATSYQKVVDEYDITEAGVDSLDYLSFDGTDDVLITTSATPASNLDFFFAIDAGADAEYMLYQLEQNAGYFIFCAQDGGGGSTSSVIAGGGLFVDGVSITNNRNALHDAATGGAHIIEQQDVNLSVYTTGARIGNWAFSGFALEGKLFGLIFSETLTADEITNTRAYLANRSGVTL